MGAFNYEGKNYQIAPLDLSARQKRDTTTHQVQLQDVPYGDFFGDELLPPPCKKNSILNPRSTRPCKCRFNVNATSWHRIDFGTTLFGVLCPLECKSICMLSILEIKKKKRKMHAMFYTETNFLLDVEKEYVMHWNCYRPRREKSDFLIVYSLTIKDQPFHLFGIMKCLIYGSPWSMKL